MLEIKTWGIKCKRVIEKTYEWVAWLWANAKIDKKVLHYSNNLYTFPRKIWEITIWQYLHMPWIFSKNGEYKKADPKHFFTNLLSNLLKEDLVMFGNLLSIEFMKPNRV